MVFRRRTTEERAESSPLAQRKRKLMVILAVAVLVSTGGLIASTQVKSPAQLAAETDEPEPSLLTAEVEHKVLASTLVVSGSFSGGRQLKFTPAAVAATDNAPGASALVLTAVHTKSGAQVTAGKVLVEVSERPVFALPGQFPAYRDLAPGLTGKDVAQLQSALGDLGYDSGDPDGHFGVSTTNAVKRFYRDLGYPVPVAGEDDAAEPIVPMSEVVFLPALPARVAAFSLRVGDTVGDPLITFSTGGPTLDARLDPADQALVKVGMKATVDSETTGFTGAGTVESIGAKTDAEDGETAYIPLRIAPAKPWPRDLESQQVRVTITTASTDEPVLAVPEAAISSSADGHTTVTVVEPDGVQRPVEVTPGLSAGGMVEVMPVGADLKPGSAVVTGEEQPPAEAETEPTDEAEPSEEPDEPEEPESSEEADEPDPSESAGG
ncbi:peptidoglycan-binding protein [Phytohabitans flavus]|uniref:peptidoglycan-binding protein n=1 Tax=Phytohabitans flavus TaxID=1076124 RepID=UPI0036424EC5